MKKKKVEKNNYNIKRLLLIFMMLLCIIISMVTYWIYAYYHKYGKNYFSDKVISYNINNYVDIQGNYVYIKNIDDKINEDFLGKQNSILKNNVIDIDINKELYNNILSIKINYFLEGNISKIISLNVDIKNKKIINDEDILGMVNYSYKDIANDVFEEYIKLPEDDNKVVIDSVTNEKISSKEFNNNDKYLIRVREYIPDKLNVYISDGKVYYAVNLYEIGSITYKRNWENILINKEIGKL